MVQLRVQVQRDDVRKNALGILRLIRCLSQDDRREGAHGREIPLHLADLLLRDSSGGTVSIVSDPGTD